MADVKRDPMTFEFTSDGPGWKGIPVVNGHKLLSVSSVDVHIDASSFPAVTLRLAAADLVKLGFGEADVMLDGETREALVSLGWSPPAEVKACFCGSVHPEGYECAIRPVPPEPDEMVAARPCGTECDC